MKNAISYYFIYFLESQTRPGQVLDRFLQGTEKWSESGNDSEEQSEWNKSEMVKVFLGHVHVNNVWRSWRDEDEKRKAENRSTVALLNSF